ncbi:MAG: transposase [Candidatus Fimenecus sp.]
MKSDLPKRKKNRLENYDYSQCGCYFITICTDKRKKLFSRIVGGDDLGAPFRIELKPYGKIVERYINSIETAYETVTVENYIIMPDHIHLMLLIDCCGAPRSSPPTISSVVSVLKRFTNEECNCKLWQRGFYDHIVRNKFDYEEIWNYIEYNALKEY